MTYFWDHPLGDAGLSRCDDRISLNLITESSKHIFKLAIHLGNTGSNDSAEHRGLAGERAAVAAGLQLGPVGDFLFVHSLLREITAAEDGHLGS